MYESAGLYGKSSLRVIDALTGAVIRSVPVAPALFAEGCARLGPVLVQLTWREKTALVYSFPGCDVLRALAYDGEGWGLTADASHFYMSNGSDTLVVRAPDFTVKRKIAVRLGGRPLKNLNELEFVNGRVYANVWYSDYIFEIDPAAGTVARIIDCAEIVGREAAGSADNVLNGIAYDPGPGLFYLTGKNWRKMFLVDLALQK
jgi:glutamine cyclotransferase